MRHARRPLERQRQKGIRAGSFGPRRGIESRYPHRIPAHAGRLANVHYLNGRVFITVNEAPHPRHPPQTRQRLPVIDPRQHQIERGQFGQERLPLVQGVVFERRERARTGPARQRKEPRERDAPLAGTLTRGTLGGRLGETRQRAAHGVELKRDLLNALLAEKRFHPRTRHAAHAEKRRSQKHGRVRQRQARREAQRQQRRGNHGRVQQSRARRNLKGAACLGRRELRSRMQRVVEDARDGGRVRGEPPHHDSDARRRVGLQLSARPRGGLGELVGGGLASHAASS